MSQAAVNSDLENLTKWLVANRLSLNVAKTEFILIGSKSMLKKTCYSHPNVHIENKKIKQVYECKTLEVTIDQPWKSNTKNICKKICSGIDLCYLSSQTLQYVSKETLISIYYALVCPYFDYEMFLVKHNRKDFKNYKIKLLQLYWV